MLYILAGICYSISILIDVFVWHLRYYFRFKTNLMYIMSLIIIFQFIARGFILIFNPVMSYLTDKLQNPNSVWGATMMSHLFVLIFLILTFNVKLSKKAAYLIILVLSKNQEIQVLPIESSSMWISELLKKSRSEKLKYFYFVFFAIIASAFYALGISFLYFLSFSYKNEILILNSFTQIVNMFGTLIFLLYIDPIIYRAFDRKEGFIEINLYALSRMMAHLFIIMVLLIMKPK